MINGRTYYDILDLPKYGINDNGDKITYTNIERAYNRLRYGISNGEGRAQIWEMPQINEAFRVLANLETRKEYDEQLLNIIEKEQKIEEQVLEVPVQEELEEQALEVPAQEEIEEQALEVPTQEELEEQVPMTSVSEETPKENNFEEIEENLNNEIDQQFETGEEQVEKGNEETENNEDELSELDSVDPNYEKRKENRKRILKNIGIIALSSTFGPIGIIASSIILIKKGKFKLQKIDKPKIIKFIQTEETKLIEQASKNLENEIDSLLDKPLTNNQDTYKLEIAKLKYQNQINLLEQRIEFKENEINKLETKVSNRLKKLALKMRLEASNKWLELRKLKSEKKLEVLNEYEPNNKQNDDLSKLNKEIQVMKDEILSGKLSDGQKYRKKIKLQKLNQKKLNKVNKLKSQRCGISRNQVALAVFDSIKNKFFNSSTPIDGEYVEVEETKTR